LPVLSLALSALLLAPAPVDAETAARAAAARTVLRGCGAVAQQLESQSDRAWTLPQTAYQDHAALRAALHEPMPRAPRSVLLYAAGGHLGTQEHSIVLVRQSDSSWVGTAVGRGKIWVEGAPYYLIPRKQWTLPAEKARRLDRILEDPCFYAEPAQFEGGRDGPPPLGALVDRLEVVSEAGMRRALFLAGDQKGLTAELLDLSLPK
jgi:hypothetical protein